jgi:hypothetical protein
MDFKRISSVAFSVVAATLVGCHGSAEPTGSGAADLSVAPVDVSFNADGSVSLPPSVTVGQRLTVRRSLSRSRPCASAAADTLVGGYGYDNVSGIGQSAEIAFRPIAGATPEFEQGTVEVPDTQQLGFYLYLRSSTGREYCWDSNAGKNFTVQVRPAEPLVSFNVDGSVTKPDSVAVGQTLKVRRVKSRRHPCDSIGEDMNLAGYTYDGRVAEITLEEANINAPYEEGSITVPDTDAIGVWMFVRGSDFGKDHDYCYDSNGGANFVVRVDRGR